VFVGRRADMNARPRDDAGSRSRRRRCPPNSPRGNIRPCLRDGRCDGGGAARPRRRGRRRSS
jgi:hypothetical protein